jgi:putative ABC transport system permease protein
VSIADDLQQDLRFALRTLVWQRRFGSDPALVEATDPGTFSLIPLVLMGVGCLACYLPARRATRIDPMVALHHD